MANIDDSNPKKEQRAEDMSLADLLGADETVTSTTPQRVDSRDDEPDSGMVRLAEMVAKSSPEQARIPSIVPPANRTDGTPSRISAVPQPIGSQQPATEATGLPSSPPRPAKTGSPTIVAISIALIAVAAAVAFFVIQKKNREETERIMQLRIQVEELEKKKQHDEMAARLAELQQREREAQKRAEEDRAAAEKAAAEKAALELALAEKQPEEQPAEEQPAKKEPPAKDAKKKDKTKPQETTKDAQSEVSAKTPDSEPAANPSKGDDELDAMLGGSKKNKDKPAPAAAAPPSGGGKPSKEDVQAAMAPVAGKAQSCARYSTGTVQLRIIVDSSGRVKQSQAIGSFANTTAGKCVEMVARTAKFSKFSDPSFTFTYPITLK